MQSSSEFLNTIPHFDLLVGKLPAADQRAYNLCRHTRVETAFSGRQFVLYRCERGEPKILDVVTVEDFEVSPSVGATAFMLSEATNSEIEVGYTPVNVGSGVFIFLPLHAKIRWDIRNPTELDSGSLGFPLVIKVQSRNHLREPGVTFFETTVSFYKEFGQRSLKV